MKVNVSCCILAQLQHFAYSGEDGRMLSEYVYMDSLGACIRRGYWYGVDPESVSTRNGLTRMIWRCTSKALKESDLLKKDTTRCHKSQEEHRAMIK